MGESPSLGERIIVLPSVEAGEECRKVRGPQGQEGSYSQGRRQGEGPEGTLGTPNPGRLVLVVR